MGNSPGSDILIKGQSVAQQINFNYNNHYPAVPLFIDTRDSMTITSYNFTNAKGNNQRRLMSAR